MSDGRCRYWIRLHAKERRFSLCRWFPQLWGWRSSYRKGYLQVGRKRLSRCRSGYGEVASAFCQRFCSWPDYGSEGIWRRKTEFEGSLEPVGCRGRSISGFGLSRQCAVWHHDAFCQRSCPYHRQQVALRKLHDVCQQWESAQYPGQSRL